LRSIPPRAGHCPDRQAAQPAAGQRGCPGRWPA